MFSQTTEYALRATACMAATPDELMPTPVLAKMAHVPPNYLAKVLQQLAAAGLITGRRGVGGGYRLAKPAGEIRLLDVINAIGEIKRVEHCPLGLEAHKNQFCALHRHADAAAEAVIKIYGGTTLHDLVNDHSPNRPLCTFQNGVTSNGSSVTISAESANAERPEMQRLPDETV